MRSTESTRFQSGSASTCESTLDAAKRELREETGLEAKGDDPRGSATARDVAWHGGGPFACSDSIHDPQSAAGFHYVISQCFAEASSAAMPDVVASDDAAGARWWSAEEVRAAEDEGAVTRGVGKVLERAEVLRAKGLLDCTDT